MAPHLLGLPRELRDKIYKNILVADSILYERDADKVKKARLRATKGNKLHPGLVRFLSDDGLLDTRILAVNHQIYAEAIHVFYKNAFYLNLDHTKGTNKMATVSRIVLRKNRLNSVEEVQRLVDAIKSCNENARSLEVNAAFNNHPEAWTRKNYHESSAYLRVLDQLREVRISGEVQFNMFGQYKKERPGELSSMQEIDFVDGFENLGKVMSGKMRAEDFQWPGLGDMHPNSEASQVSSDAER